MSREDELFNEIKGLWTGRQYVGAAADWCHTDSFAARHGESVDWDSKGSYLLKITGDNREWCWCRSYLVDKSGAKWLVTQSFALSRAFLKSKIEFGSLVRCKNV